MDEDQILQSIIADPQLTDPSIDTSGLRTATDTRAELLANVPEFSGLKFDPTQRSYIEDLYSVYGGGLPTIPEPVVEDTAQIPGAVDTLVDVGGGGGQDQVTGGLDTGNTAFEQNLINQGVGVQAEPGALISAPGEGMLTQEAIDDLADYPITPNLDDIDLGNPFNDPRIVSEEQGLTGTPQIVDPIMDPNLMEIRQQQNIEGLTAPQQNLISQAFSKVGSTAETIMEDLSKIPGAIANFAEKTVDIAGKKINVGKTLLSAGINRIAGGPISLVFDAIGALVSQLPSEDPANTLTRNIVDELKASGKDYGFNMQSGNLNQDPFGRNPVSGFGDYEGTLINDINNPSDTKMGNAKKEFAQDYFDAKAVKAGGAVTEPGTVVGPGEFPSTQDDFDVFNEAAVNVGTPSFDGFDSGGFDPAPEPAPAPAPAPAPSYNYGGGGGRDSGGGGGGGSSSGGGGESGYGGFCFDPNTPIQMANGSNKKIKDIKLGDDTKGGEVTGVFQFKATDEIHDYKGVTVAGSHYVKEDGKFIMVQDSPISIKIDKIPVVYSLDTTGRRIFIKDIEFADYNGDGIAKGFLHNAGVNTKGFDKEVLRQVEQRLI